MAILDKVTITVTEGTSIYLKPGDWREKCHAYTVTLTYNGREMELPYYKGASLTSAPEVTEVLECLVLDSIYADCKDEYEFADMVGDTPSREMRDEWLQSVEQTAMMRAMLGADYAAMLEEIDDLVA